MIIKCNTLWLVLIVNAGYSATLLGSLDNSLPDLKGSTAQVCVAQQQGAYAKSTTTKQVDNKN